MFKSKMLDNKTEKSVCCWQILQNWPEIVHKIVPKIIPETLISTNCQKNGTEIVPEIDRKIVH